MRVRNGVCGYCHPGLPRSEQKKLEQSPVIRLPNGVSACHECYTRIVLRRYERERDKEKTAINDTIARTD